MLSTVLLRSLAQYGSIRWRQVVQIYDLPRDCFRRCASLHRGCDAAIRGTIVADNAALRRGWIVSIPA